MPQADGKSYDFLPLDSIRHDYLETIDYAGERQKVVYETSEFSAVCPFSGLPDYGSLKIEYCPDNHIIELKSLKYYIISYRSVGIYQEAATDRLASDLFACIKPLYLVVTTRYNTRGGIDTVCTLEKGDRDFRHDWRVL